MQFRPVPYSSRHATEVRGRGGPISCIVAARSCHRASASWHSLPCDWVDQRSDGLVRLHGPREGLFWMRDCQRSIHRYVCPPWPLPLSALCSILLTWPVGLAGTKQCAHRTLLESQKQLVLAIPMSCECSWQFSTATLVGDAWCTSDKLALWLSVKCKLGRRGIPTRTKYRSTDWTGFKHSSKFWHTYHNSWCTPSFQNDPTSSLPWPGLSPLKGGKRF